MADWSLEWDQHGMEQFVVQTEELMVRAQDVSPALEEAVHDLHNEQMAKIFDSEGATSADGRWRPLSAHTKRGRSILNKTGDLKRSYTDPSHPSHVWEVGQNSVTAGSNHRIAEIHERGGSKIPKRSVQKSKLDQDALDDLVWKFIVGEEGG